MRRIFKNLVEDEEFLTAAIHQVRVFVVENHEGRKRVVDYGGPIRKYTPEFVKVSDTYYNRAIHEFKVQKE
ncbi:hypothetical protein [Paenibacillus aceti]|uniref:Uncharacterized protein n=1 Tax=Paenibacillus aceti TaxID=1820010 RepID=A0ABQ1WAM7_9BACL|nr:hypothetical protein [Paenibacillus aceti]GGG20425.1 hypothetical protein GCM10010913_48320 [Paenibacillus aceti]